MQPDEGKVVLSADDEAKVVLNADGVYKDLCDSYRAIDDFRTKLLGFLPLATGAGAFALLGKGGKLEQDTTKFFKPLGIFGLLITCGLYVYELYGIKKCHFLIETGKHLECKARVPGQFQTRPCPVFGKFDEVFAAAVIYPAVLAAWTFFALVFTSWCRGAWVAAIAVFLLGFVFSARYGPWLKKTSEEELKKKLEAASPPSPPS